MCFSMLSTMQQIVGSLYSEEKLLHKQIEVLRHSFVASHYVVHCLGASE